jgi:hypothetical protein
MLFLYNDLKQVDSQLVLRRLQARNGKDVRPPLGIPKRRA